MNTSDWLPMHLVFVKDFLCAFEVCFLLFYTSDKLKKNWKNRCLETLTQICYTRKSMKRADQNHKCTSPKSQVSRLCGVQTTDISLYMLND